MLPISVCIIAKNEEAHIEECLKALKQYHYEIVLTDTGSTDHTLEIAAKYTENIYHFGWCNDFSAAKNFCIAQASNDWVLNIDCDEYVESIDENELSRLMERYPESAGRILIRNRITEKGVSDGSNADGNTNAGSNSNMSDYGNSGTGSGSDSIGSVSYENVRVSRLVNRKYFHFVGAVHEQLERKTTIEAECSIGAEASLAAETAFDTKTTAETTKKAIPKTTFSAPISVVHVGYDGTEEEMREKSLRNIALLEKELAANGADAYLYYQLGQSCMKLKDYEKAYEWFNLGLSMDVEPHLDYVQGMVESYGYCLLEMKRFQEALQLEGIYDIFAVRADFVFLMGLIYMNNGLLNEAVREFEKCTSMEEFCLDGINSYRANYNIGVIYECSGHLEKAREYYRKCGNYGRAKERLAVIGK